MRAERAQVYSAVPVSVDISRVSNSPDVRESMHTYRLRRRSRATEKRGHDTPSFSETVCGA